MTPRRREERLRVMMLGSGARAHALANRILQSSGDVWCVPAVEPWEPDPRIHAVPAHSHLGELVEWAVDQAIHLVVGLDEYSAHADAAADFEAHGIAYFGPSRAAAALERSKLHSRRVLESLGFEVPKLLRVVEAPTDPTMPESFPVVLRLDQAPSARGVRVARNSTEYSEALGSLAHVHASTAGEDQFTVLVEAFVTGLEVTFAVLAGPRAMVELPPVRDYKAFEEGDVGPFTSGMGGYSPVPALGPDAGDFARGLFTRVLDDVAGAGSPYTGYLNANLIYRDGRWVVLEFNCHMGDPDLVLLLPQVDGDLAQILHDLATGQEVSTAMVRPMPTVGVSLVQAGYPAAALRADDVIARPDSRLDNLYLFRSRRVDDRLYPMGGRVLLACATSTTFSGAIELAYDAAAVAQAANPALVYRRDLGREAVL